MENEKFKYFNMLKDKRGINDISIIAVLTFIFFLTAIIIPFVNTEFNTGFVEPDTDGLSQEIRDDAENISTISAFGVLLTVLKLAFFDFGNSLQLPFWLDALYTILGIILIFVIARNIWIGGGG